MNQEILSLRKDAVELPSILLNGFLLKHGETWAALPREVVSNGVENEFIVFEMIRPGGVSKPSFLTLVLRSIRPETLTITAMPCLAVILCGFSKNWDFHGPLACVSLLGVVFLQIAVNILNDVEDHLRMIDVRGASGGSGVLQKGWISARGLRKGGYFSFILGVLFGLPAVLDSPEVLGGIGAIAALGVLSYSDRFFGVKYRPIGDLCLFALVGPLLTVGLSQAAFGKFDASIFFLGLFFGLNSWGIAHSGNLRDMEADSRNGIRTWASRLGFKASRHALAGIYLAAFLSLWIGFSGGALPLVVCLPAFLVIPFIVQLLMKVYKASGPASALLGPIRSSAAQIHLILGGLVCTGFLLQSVFNFWLATR